MTIAIIEAMKLTIIDAIEIQSDKDIDEKSIQQHTPNIFINSIILYILCTKNFNQ